MTYIPFTPTSEHIEILKETKKRLLKIKTRKLSEPSYICLLISSVLPDSNDVQKNELKDWIAHMIYPWGSLLTWLPFVAGIPLEDTTRLNMLTYRLEWVEHLIQILEEQIS